MKDALTEHMNNPWFWLLVGVLIVSGWVYLNSEFGVKKLGRIKVGLP